MGRIDLKRRDPPKKLDLGNVCFFYLDNVWRMILLVIANFMLQAN